MLGVTGVGMNFSSTGLRGFLFVLASACSLSARQTIRRYPSPGVLATSANPVYSTAVFRDSSSLNAGFYLGASSSDPQAGFSLSFATLSDQVVMEGQDDYHIQSVLTLGGQPQGLTPLLVENATINNSADITSSSFVANPLYNNYFIALDRYDSFARGVPVVVPADHPEQIYFVEGLGRTNDADRNQLYNKLIKLIAGNTLKDAAGSLNAVISAIVAPSSRVSTIHGAIFAGVGANTTLALAGVTPSYTNDTAKGIQRGLIPFNMVNGSAGNASYSLTTAIGVQSTIQCFYWDEVTARLYVGLKTNLTHGLSGAGSYVMGVWVVQFTTTGTYAQVAAVYPLINPAFIDVPHASIGQITPGSNFEINKMTTLHATTGKSYLIVQGGKHTTGPDDNTYRVGLWAFPIIRTSDTAALVGRASDDTDNTILATTLTSNSIVDMAGNFSTFPQFNSDNVQISDICVAGDTILAAVKRVDPTDPTYLSYTGVFATTALFDSNGYIRGWSEWKRHSYYGEDVHNVGYDSLTGRLWAVIGAGHDAVVVNDWERDTVKTFITSDVLYSIGSPSRTVQDYIAQEYSQNSQGGVTGVGSLDLADYGTSDVRTLTPFASRHVQLLGVGGDSKVTFIEAGHGDGSTPSQSEYQNSIYDTSRIKTFNNLSSLGLIHSFCTVQDGILTNRWIVIAGSKGFAVFARTNGFGFQALSADDWLTQIDTMGARIFTEIADVKSIAFDQVHSSLFVLTPKKIYEISLSTNKFKSAAPDPLNPSLYASITDLPGATAQDEFLCMEIYGGALAPAPIGARCVVGTTRGLYHTLIESISFTELISPVLETLDGHGSLGPVRALQLFREDRYNSEGNLYAFVSRRSRDSALIYRFDMSGTPAPIVDASGREYLVNIGASRERALVDAGHIHHALVPLQSATDYLKLITLQYTTAGTRVESNEPVNYKDLPTRLTALARVAGWSSLVLATNWGISVRD